MKVTVLIENTAGDRPEGLACEHGLSRYIEHSGRKYLLDSGGSDRFIQNAKLLNIPLQEVDTAFLSHGHFDHSGGFAAFFRENDHAPLFMMDHAGAKYYSTASGEPEYIGIPDELKEHFSDRIRYVREKTKITEGVWLLPHTAPGLDRIGVWVKMFRKSGDEMIPDDFSHEMSLVMETEKGLVVFNSCTHSGLEVVIEEVNAAFPGQPVSAFVGGLHMRGVDPNPMFCLYTEQEIQRLAQFLRRRRVGAIWTGHCTGPMGFHLMEKYLGDEVMHQLTTGETFEI